MADEPEDVSATSRNPPGPQQPDRHERTHSLLLEELSQRGALPAAQMEKVLVWSLCALKHHLEWDAGEEFRIQLPLKIQQVLQSCEPQHDHASCSAEVDELLTKVAAELGTGQDHAESVIRGVLATVRAQLPEFEAEHVSESLPLPLWALWALPL